MGRWMVSVYPHLSRHWFGLIEQPGRLSFASVGGVGLMFCRQPNKSRRQNL